MIVLIRQRINFGVSKYDFKGNEFMTIKRQFFHFKTRIGGKMSDVTVKNYWEKKSIIKWVEKIFYDTNFYK